MTTSDSALEFATKLEALARGIRNGSVFLTHASWHSPDFDVREFLASTYEPDTDVEGEPYTPAEVEEMRQSSLDYLSMFNGLILFYKEKKPKKRKK